MNKTEFQGQIKAIAVDCDNVYFAGSEDLVMQGVYYLQKGVTDAPIQAFSAYEGSVPNIVVDGSHVVWTDGLSAVRISYKALGVPTTPYTLAPSQQSPVGLAMDSARVYWSNAAALPGQRAILSAPIPAPGGQPEIDTLVAGQGPRALAVDESAVYWIDDARDELWKVPKGGGTPVLVRGLVSSSNHGDVLAIQGDYLYWIQDDMIFRTRKDGTEATMRVFRASDVMAGFDTPTWLALDQSRIYVAGTDMTANKILWVGR